MRRLQWESTPDGHLGTIAAHPVARVYKPTAADPDRWRLVMYVPQPNTIRTAFMYTSLDACTHAAEARLTDFLRVALGFA